MASSLDGSFAVGSINYLRRDASLIADKQATGLRQGGEFIKDTARGSKKGLSNLEAHDMHIQDARQRMASLSLDREGFQVANHKTALPETLEVLFEDDEGEIRKTYWPEIVELAQRTLTSDGRRPKYVFALGTQKFTESKDRGLLGAYSRQAHCDFSDVVFDGAWKMLSKRGVPEDEAHQLDIMFVNAWKPFGRMATDNPLAILDWTSVDPSDVHSLPRGTDVDKDTIYSALLRHNPNHRWYYLSMMTPEEVWFFKQADSRANRNDVSKGAFHTSFKIEGAEERARRSIAVRLILGFERATDAPRAAAL